MSLGCRNQRDRALILEALSATLRHLYFAVDVLRTSTPGSALTSCTFPTDHHSCGMNRLDDGGPGAGVGRYFRSLPGSQGERHRDSDISGDGKKLKCI